MTARKAIPKPPVKLAKAGLRLWNGVCGDYSLTERHHLELLLQACISLDRAEQAAVQIRKRGVVVEDRWGQARANPAVPAERDARALAIRALAALGLDLEPAGSLTTGRTR